MRQALPRSNTQRGPTGPRLLVRTALAAGLLLALGSCGHFGPGLAELPADQGWQRLPVVNWIIDDMIRPQAVVFCPAETCAAPAVVAVFRVAGPEAVQLEQLIGRDPARLLRPPATTSDGRRRTPDKPGKPAHPGSRTEVEALKLGTDNGARITLISKAGDGRSASGVILARREEKSLAIALAITTDPDKALTHAKAGLASLR